MGASLILLQTNKQTNTKHIATSISYSVLKKQQDRSRRCQYIKSFDFFLTHFATLNKMYIIKWRNMSKFVISESISIKTDILLAWINKFDFGRHFEFFPFFSKKIKTKLRLWELPGEKVQNGRHDVIDFKMWKSEKIGPSVPCKYLLDHL